MYTGIVETTTSVTAVDHLESGCRLRVETPSASDFDLEADLLPEDSVAVDGVCVTVDRRADVWFEAFLSAETVSRTHLADLSPDDRVNLERPLSAAGRFHGHIVKGTVDTTTPILEIDSLAAGRELTVAIPDGYERFVVEKGAVALDGISLTVAAVDDTDGRFDVAVVPATASVTTLSETRVGDRLHFEADVVAKYATRAAAFADAG